MFNLTEETKSNKFLVIDLFTEWCNPCKSISAMIDDLKAKYSDVKFLKVDAEENSELSNSLDISGVPTLLFYKDGALIDRANGFIPRQKFVEKIEALIH